jgi:hypothetical protein
MVDRLQKTGDCRGGESSNSSASMAAPGDGRFLEAADHIRKSPPADAERAQATDAEIVRLHCHDPFTTPSRRGCAAPNPKLEIRNPKQTRNPKSEIRSPFLVLRSMRSFVVTAATRFEDNDDERDLDYLRSSPNLWEKFALIRGIRVVRFVVKRIFLPPCFCLMRFRVSALQALGNYCLGAFSWACASLRPRL